MKDKVDAKTKEFLMKCRDDGDLAKQFGDDPVGTLKAHGIDPSDMPEEVLDKIAAGGSGSSAAVGAAAACA